ncbi:MAG: SulP family inorganic anion transporter [Bacteroidota bacterium]
MKSYLLRNFTFNPKDDVLSGLTVALALVPEAVAFAFVAGLDPLIGLYGAFMMGLITSVLGGRPGMISGATGAMAVVMIDLILKGNTVGQGLEQPAEFLGVKWLFIALLLAGAMQIAAGIFRLGKFVRLIPRPVMMGFVNGLAIVIFLAQLKMFPEVQSEETFLQNPLQWLQVFFSNARSNWMLLFIALTMGIMYILPKFTKAIPSALVAIIVVALISVFSGLGLDTVESFIRSKGGADLSELSISDKLPVFQSGLFGWLGTLEGHWSQIFSTAAILAAVGLIESLLTLNLVDELTETRGSGNRECVAQGIANITNGFFGGMGGCAMIGQSIINVNSGGRGRLSGITAAIALFLFILFGASIIEKIPIAALVGVMFMVVIGTFAWSSLRIMNKIPFADAFVLVAVSAITVIADLAIAVICGVIISALVFAWKNAKMIRARKHFKDKDTKVYEIWGPLFFGSVQAFNAKFDPKNDPENIEIDFIESRVNDHSGIEAIRSIANKYLALDKKITLTHLSPDCRKLLVKANPKFKNIIERSVDDPRYYVVSDFMDKEV